MIELTTVLGHLSSAVWYFNPQQLKVFSTTLACFLSAFQALLINWIRWSSVTASAATEKANSNINSKLIMIIYFSVLLPKK